MSPTLEGWPPAAADYYLAASAARPLFQGDILTDVPFTKAKSAGDPQRDPNVVIERRLVAVVGYPCDMYHEGKLVKAQTIAPVTAAARAGIPANWDGAFTFAPLPDLLDDDEMYAVDLRTATNIDVSYIQPAKRLRSLSELGWAVLRQRMALCDTRALIPLDALQRVGASLWQELALWQRWNEAGRQAERFQAWLAQPDIALGGFVRRVALERGMYPQVRALLERDLAA